MPRRVGSASAYDDSIPNDVRRAHEATACGEPRIPFTNLTSNEGVPDGACLTSVR